MSTAFIIAGFLIGIGLVLIFSRSARQKVVGICKVALGQTARKQENKEKVLELLQERGELSNSDIREVLGVSPRTAVDYMDELEEEGKVEQVGDIGQGVVYRLK